MNKLHFNLRYALLTLLFFTSEVCIALYVHDHIVRPYIGDLLVVILIYCFVRTFLKISTWEAGVAVLLFAYLVEATQYFKLASRLGLGDSPIAVAIMGNSFAWMDMLMYTLGVFIIFIFEKK